MMMDLMIPPGLLSDEQLSAATCTRSGGLVITQGSVESHLYDFLVLNVAFPGLVKGNAV